MYQPDHFNRHMLVMARESRGLTQSGLANKMGVSQGTISKIESGTTVPPTSFTNEVSNTLDYEPEFFYETGRPYGMPPFHFRKRKKLGTKALEKMIAEMNIRRIHLRLLLKSYELSGHGTIPQIERDELTEDLKVVTPEDAARQLREIWLLPKGPIESIVDLLEDIGGIVIPCNFNSELVDAVSQRIDGFPVLFFVNMNRPADRIRWTLAHELGHMILHTSVVLDDSVMEEEADEFASALLLPANEVKPQLRDWNLRKVAQLKQYWKVSMQAIAMRAFNLGLITPHQKKSFFIQLGKLGYRKREPYEPKKEWPSTIRKIISYHLNELKYSTKELAKILFVSEKEFLEMYTPAKPSYSTPKPRLKVVK